MFIKHKEAVTFNVMLMHSEAKIRYNFYPVILAKYTGNVFVFEG